MKRTKNKVILLLFLISIIFINVLNVKADILSPSENGQYDYLEYVIDKYNVDINVNENNTLDITETITAYFNVDKHGIFRTIPLKNEVVRLDGSTSKNRVQITNVSVDSEYSTSKQSGNYKIKIGSADKVLTGKQNYVIKYTYNLGKDPLKEIDELYYNIIGNEWDTVIGNVTFKITMPKEFDSSKLGFSKGQKGSTSSSGIIYNVDGNTITGSYNGILNVGDGLTVRCELPEGYFVGAGLEINIMNYIVYLFPIIFLIISVLLWYKYGRDDKVIETVEFYPPDGFNSLEVAFLFKGKADNQDVVSLLIYLANKGYIKIAETEEKGLFGDSKSFKITKLKNYDGNNINEQLFLEGLFTKKTSSVFKKDKIETVNEVTAKDLYNNFYITVDKILANTNNKENKNKIFEKSASNKLVFVILMIIATYCLITIPPFIDYGDVELAAFAILFPGIGFTTSFMFLLENHDSTHGNDKPSIFVDISILVFGIMFGGLPCIFIALPLLILEPIYLIGYLIGILCSLGMVACYKYLPKRTPYGNEMLGKLLGFKNFLKVAEKDKLEAMVNENPNYFYDILPYTYVLGVSDKWISKFETISLKAPDWYDSPSAFDMVAFSSFMNNTMVSAASAMTSSPSSSSSGSGGGSSGGGSGGGGGGSW